MADPATIAAGTKLAGTIGGEFLGGGGTPTSSSATSGAVQHGVTVTPTMSNPFNLAGGGARGAAFETTPGGSMLYFGPASGATAAATGSLVQNGIWLVGGLAALWLILRRKK